MFEIKPLSAPNPASPTGDAASRQARAKGGLRLHQVLLARVTRQTPEGVELKTATRNLQAQTDLPLTVGQRLALQVASVGEQVELRLLHQPPPTGRLELHPLFHSWRLGPGLRALAGAGDDSAYLPFPPVFQEPLRTLLDRFQDPAAPPTSAGLRLWAAFAERLLGKPAAGNRPFPEKPEAKTAHAKKTRQGDHAAEDGADRASAERLLTALRLCSQQLARQERYFLPLPLPFVEQGFLLCPGEQDCAESAFDPPLLSLHLDLERLGPLRIDILPDGGALALRFFCATATVADEIRQQAKRLQDSPQAGLFQNMQFVAGASQPAAALLREILPEGASLRQMRI